MQIKFPCLKRRSFVIICPKPYHFFLLWRAAAKIGIYFRERGCNWFSKFTLLRITLVLGLPALPSLFFFFLSLESQKIVFMPSQSSEREWHVREWERRVVKRRRGQKSNWNLEWGQKAVLWIALVSTSLLIEKRHKKVHLGARMELDARVNDEPQQWRPWWRAAIFTASQPTKTREFQRLSSRLPQLPHHHHYYHHHHHAAFFSPFGEEGIPRKLPPAPLCWRRLAAIKWKVCQRLIVSNHPNLTSSQEHDPISPVQCNYFLVDDQVRIVEKIRGTWLLTTGRYEQIGLHARRCRRE